MTLQRTGSGTPDSEGKWPNPVYELLADIAEFVFKEIAPVRGREVAIASGFSLAGAIQKQFSGTQIYIPGSRGDSWARYEAIEEEFCGHNWIEICRKFGISRGRIYQIVRAVRARRKEGKDQVRSG